MTTIKRIKSAIERLPPKPSCSLSPSPSSSVTRAIESSEWQTPTEECRRQLDSVSGGAFHMCERLLLDDFASIICECLTMRFSIQQFNTWKWKVVCHFANAFSYISLSLYTYMNAPSFLPFAPFCSFDRSFVSSFLCLAYNSYSIVSAVFIMLFNINSN